MTLTIAISRLDGRTPIEPFSRPLPDHREVSACMNTRRVDVITLKSHKVLRWNRGKIRITHNQLSKVIHAMCFMHWSVHGILRIDVRVDGHPEVVEAVEGVEGIQSGYVSAVMYVPVYRWVGTVGFSGLVIREEEVSILRKSFPSLVDLATRPYVLETWRVERYEAVVAVEVQASVELLLLDAYRCMSVTYGNVNDMMVENLKLLQYIRSSVVKPVAKLPYGDSRTREAVHRYVQMHATTVENTHRTTTVARDGRCLAVVVTNKTLSSSRGWASSDNSCSSFVGIQISRAEL